jgi:hypothetical protein
MMVRDSRDAVARFTSQLMPVWIHVIHVKSTLQNQPYIIHRRKKEPERKTVCPPVATRSKEAATVPWQTKEINPVTDT